MKKVLFYTGFTLLMAIGLFLQFALIGYSFLAMVCFGIAALLICYRLLSLLARTHLQTAKALRTILSVCLMIGLLAAALTGIQIARSAAGAPDAECDYMVVLGAGVNGTVPSLALHNRLVCARDYLQAHPNSICIVSGGQGPGEDISEALCMYNYLTTQGIDSARVWMEDKATSTQENIAFSLSLIESRTGTRPDEIGILSSEYHLHRAAMVAANQGVSTVGIPGKTTLPVLFLNYFLREIPAVWYYTLFGG